MNSAWWFNALLVAFTFVLAGVGIIQSFLLYYTYKVSESSAEASRESARASRDSAAAAQRALHLGRPVLVVRQIKQGNGNWREDGCFGAEVLIRNLGQRAAIITEAVIGFVLLNGPAAPGQKLRAPHYEWGEVIAIDQPVVAADGDLRLWPFWGVGASLNRWKPDATPFDGVSQQEISEILNHKLQLNVYGIVHYRDAAAPESYDTAFFWHYRFPDNAPATATGDYYVGPARFQHST